ncbi:MAG: hemolysin family protein [Myxococcota bacterium]
MATTLLIVYVLAALGISFLCSIWEAALLSTREMELSRRAEDGEKAAQRLLTIKRERVDDAISSILTLNTIAHTVGATMAGAQAAIVFGDEWVGVFSGVLTFLVLVVTEIIPKTLGTVYASRLIGFVGSSLVILMKALTPILIFTRLLTRLFTNKGHHEQQVSRRELAALVAVAARQGQLEQDVTSTLSNVLRFDDVKVTDIMTPRTVTAMLPVDATVDDLLESVEHQQFSRIPLFEEQRDNIKGYVLARDALIAALQEEGPSAKLASFLRPIKFVPSTMSVSSLLRQLLEWHEHLAIVVDEFGGMEGLITLEDVIETLLGREILDELDTVADLRALAVELRDKRRRRRPSMGPADETAPPVDSSAPPVDG